MSHVVAEPSISAVVVLDQQGERIAARYFSDDLQTLANQQVFEKALLAKALKTSTTDPAGQRKRPPDVVLFEATSRCSP
ncbi:hypothetical protein T484DRAFT_1787779 [Baffinella frigidus]|nr:hypothetical protein T484DRAFT_1787779 [Cryptophyta sp. CCMP2293]